MGSSTPSFNPRHSRTCIVRRFIFGRYPVLAMRHYARGKKAHKMRRIETSRKKLLKKSIIALKMKKNQGNQLSYSYEPGVNVNMTGFQESTDETKLDGDIETIYNVIPFL